MSNEVITVNEAIRKGLKVIYLPSKVTLISSVVFSLLLLPLSFASLLLVPVAVVLSTVYTWYATVQWRIWAYRRVNDIHQLQRSAELAGLLTVNSRERMGGIASPRQRSILKELQQRFLEEYDFIDDPSIPAETVVYSGGLSNNPVITISSMGIEVQGEDFCAWTDITDERIAHVGFARYSPWAGQNVSVGSANFIRYQTAGRGCEIPLSAINKPAWEIDLLFYIYRGRFNAVHKAKLIPRIQSPV